MANQIVLVVGGLGIIGLGFCYLLSPEFARKFFYARAAIGRQPRMRSKHTEQIGLTLIRFALGPALIILGSLLIARG